ncbi:MAG TPA: hypothetical protein VFM29_03200 [Vicinamibacteria bacterium]|nr:hypothetical protein [Vicinamibacteria bacterium]
MSDRSREKGEGKLGSIIGLLVFIAVCVAAWNVAPVYIANYTFEDKLNQIARTPKGMGTDDRLMDEIMREASRQKIDTFMNRQSCVITTRENSRQIECAYNRQVDVLPGWKHLFKFNPKVDQPLI